MKKSQEILFLVVILSIGTAFLLMSFNLSMPEDRLTPLFFAAALVILVFMELDKMRRSRDNAPRGEGEINDAKSEETIRVSSFRIVTMIVWLLAPVLGFSILGFRVTVPAFIFLYIKLSGKSWLTAFLVAGITAVFFVVVCEEVLRIHFYRGFLFELSR